MNEYEINLKLNAKTMTVLLAFAILIGSSGFVIAQTSGEELGEATHTIQLTDGISTHYLETGRQHQSNQFSTIAMLRDQRRADITDIAPYNSTHVELKVQGYGNYTREVFLITARVD